MLVHPDIIEVMQALGFEVTGNRWGFKFTKVEDCYVTYNPGLIECFGWDDEDERYKMHASITIRTTPTLLEWLMLMHGVKIVSFSTVINHIRQHEERTNAGSSIEDVAASLAFETA